MSDEAKRQVLVVDDDQAVGQVLCALLAQAGHAATLVASGEAAVAELERKPFELVLTDVRMPGLGGLELLELAGLRWPEVPVVLLTAHATVALAVEAMKAGAADFLQKPFDREEILFVVQKALTGARAAQQAPPREKEGQAALEALLGTSAELETLRGLVRRAAAAEATVLVRGESGTGKELVARALHALSPRARGPFVKLNCGALPDTLLESELFGYEKGAFTGAVQRKPGRAELAAGGTLFLDEVGDVTPALQVKLLRLLQEKEYERLGGTETIKADLRFVAATHRPLEEMVKKGEFREDLFYRLNVVPLTVAPLRSRAGDVPLLAESFCARLAQRHGREVALSPQAVEVLAAQSWPGNVRQLQNLLERLVVLTDGAVIGAEAVRAELSRDGAAPAPATSGQTLEAQRTQVERAAVQQALEKAKGNRTLAARLLGVSRRTLYNKLEALGLEAPRGG